MADFTGCDVHDAFGVPCANSIASQNQLVTGWAFLAIRGLLLLLTENESLHLAVIGALRRDFQGVFGQQSSLSTFSAVLCQVDVGERLMQFDVPA